MTVKILLKKLAAFSTTRITTLAELEVVRLSIALSGAKYMYNLRSSCCMP
jgi:hypothetical protein